jgi:hypothetical protein
VNDDEIDYGRISDEQLNQFDALLQQAGPSAGYSSRRRWPAAMRAAELDPDNITMQAGLRQHRSAPNLRINLER